MPMGLCLLDSKLQKAEVQNTYFLRDAVCLCAVWTNIKLLLRLKQVLQVAIL